MTDERPGDPNCIHEWVYDPWVVATYPATYHKICKRCGRLVHERREALPMHDESYEELKKHFENKDAGIEEKPTMMHWRRP